MRRQPVVIEVRLNGKSRRVTLSAEWLRAQGFYCPDPNCALCKGGQ